METTVNKGVYEAPKAEISIVISRDILTDSGEWDTDVMSTHLF